MLKREFKKVNSAWILNASFACAALGAGLLTTACSRDPSYPPLQQNHPAEQEHTDPAFSLDVPDVIEWKEGEAQTVELNARVPEPGHALLTAAGLPPDASFDAKTGKVIWTPGFDAADDPKDPTQVSKTFPVKFTIRSDRDQVSFVTRTVYFLVHNVARNFSLDVSGSSSGYTLTENRDFTLTVNVKSEDFPSGPFNFLPEGLPSGAQIVKVSATQYQIKYHPSLSEVTSADRSDFSCNCFSKDFKINLSASNPRGEITQVNSLTLTVRDDRQAPAISGPSQVVQGTNGIFAVSAIDPNGESTPSLKITKDPGVGYIAAHESPTNLQNTLQVEWKGVPQNLQGTIQDFNLQSCVPAARNGTKCANYVVHVQVSGAANQPPALDRAQWPSGKQMYALANQAFKIRLPVRDPSNPAAPPTVRLKSSVASDSLNYSNGEFSFTGRSTGLRTLEINVTASNGLAVSETFSLEVLPSTWTQHLVAVETAQSNEAAKNVDLFKPAEAVNLPQAGDHALVYRAVLIAGSEALMNPANRDVVEKAAGKIDEVVIASPKAGDFTGALATELQGLGLSFVPVTGLATDFEMVPAPNSGLTPSFVTVHLTGKLTTASVNVTEPVLAPSSKCQAIMNYRKAGVADVTAAVLCPRAQGGNILVSGFEWGDLDSNLAARQWISKLLTRMVK
jgi:hypothetical protein